MRILYFAWLRQKVGTGEETVDPPNAVATVGELVTWLSGKSEGHAEALGDPQTFRVAVNQTFADLDAPVSADDEIAFFPPVTGG